MAPIRPKFKRFETGRPGKMHFIVAGDKYIATQEWVDAAPTGYSVGGDLEATCANKIAYIKAIANEAAHGEGGGGAGTTDAFYDKRVTLIVGTLDESIVGAGWAAAGDKAWVRIVFMDEADHLDGNFDYVELEDIADGCGFLAYEYVY